MPAVAAEAATPGDSFARAIATLQALPPGCSETDLRRARLRVVGRRGGSTGSAIRSATMIPKAQNRMFSHSGDAAPELSPPSVKTGKICRPYWFLWLRINAGLLEALMNYCDCFDLRRIMLAMR